MPRDPLAPDRGNPADLLVAGAMAVMFFTPVGGKIIGAGIGGVSRGGKAIGKTVSGMATRGMARVKGMDTANIALGAKRVGLKTWGAATAVGDAGAAGMEFVARYHRAIGAVAIGGAAVAGVARSAYDEPSPGMPADNLGATGDLTLALHQRR